LWTEGGPGGPDDPRVDDQEPDGAGERVYRSQILEEWQGGRERREQRDRGHDAPEPARPGVMRHRQGREDDRGEHAGPRSAAEWKQANDRNDSQNGHRRPCQVGPTPEIGSRLSQRGDPEPDNDE